MTGQSPRCTGSDRFRLRRTSGRPFSSTNPLLVFRRAGLEILRLLGPFIHNAERSLQELRGLFAVGTLEAHGINLDFARGGHDDFNGATHTPPPSKTSLMLPFRCGCRRTDKPFLRASAVAL